MTTPAGVSVRFTVDNKSARWHSYRMENKLTHFNSDGRARMVDVSAKEATERVAVASGRCGCSPIPLSSYRQGR